MGPDTQSSLDVDLHPRKSTLRKYFSSWRRKVKMKKEKEEIMSLKLEQREKLDDLVKTLKQNKLQKVEALKIEENRSVSSNYSTKSEESFKNRFQAQKGVIDKLTTQLEERNRLIEDLRLGILRDEAYKSLNDSKIEISEIFGNCSLKTKLKITPPVEYVEKFMVATQKAPRFLREVQARSAERAKKHEIIQERKRVIDEKRRRIIEEALEKKRTQDEEEKKRNLDVIKERRRKELEREKLRQANKSIYLEKIGKAVALHNRILKRDYFGKLFFFYRECKFNQIRSFNHYKMTLLGKVVNGWKDIIEEKYKFKYMMADELFAIKILVKTLQIWKEERMEGIRNHQVAEDFHDFKLQKNFFVHWHRHVCTQIVLEEKKLKIASNHHNRRILFNSFHQWRSFPAVMQLERAKEEKKKKWREKVWEILPDYKPPQD